MSLPEAIQQLAADRTSGASAIAQRAAQILSQWVAQSPAQDERALRAQLIEAARALVSAQPAMIPLLSLANRVLWAIEPMDSLEEVRATVASTCAHYVAQVRSAQSRIAQNALETIPAQARVLTHSFSSTVWASLVQAGKEGRLRGAICTESKPGMEGQRLKNRLVAEGIAAQSIADEAAPSLATEVDAVWVGADALSEGGLINKIGTSALARAAHRHGTPFFTLCSTDKIPPAGYPSPFPTTSASAEGEMVGDLFDLTPLQLVTAAITEDGILHPAAIVHYVSRTPLHPALR